MTHDLPDLLRRTFDERAAEITTGPRWDETAVRRRRWPVVAIAASVAALAVGAAIWRADGPTPAPAAAHVTRACRAPLPAAWRSALDARPIEVAGRPALVVGALRDGAAVAETGGFGHERVVLIDRSGAVSTLYRLPRNASDFQMDVDEPYVAIDMGLAHRNRAGVEVTSGRRIEVVDTRTRRHVGPLAHAPAGSGPGPTANPPGVAMLDGTVYWTVAGTAATGGGVVIGYRPSSDSYRQVGTYHGSGELYRDAREVRWHGGSVVAEHLPAAVRASHEGSFEAVALNSVVSDGTDFAWASDSGRLVHWVGRDGRSDTVRMKTFRVPRTRIDDRAYYQPVLAVAGPYVLMFTSVYDATYHVLDTRTGAIADTRLGPGGLAYAAGSTLYLTRPYRPGVSGTVVLPTATLGQLRC